MPSSRKGRRGAIYMIDRMRVSDTRRPAHPGLTSADANVSVASSIHIRKTTDDTAARPAENASIFRTGGAPMQIATIANDEIEEFDRIDGNGDRSITFEEFSRLMLEMDHAKPATELASLLQHHRPRPGWPSRSRGFQALDQSLTGTGCASLRSTAASSSIKCAVVDVNSGTRSFELRLENIGGASPKLIIGASQNELTAPLNEADAIGKLMAELKARWADLGKLDAVVHRVVHGGQKFLAPTRRRTGFR